MLKHKPSGIRQKEIVAAVRNLIIHNGSENITMKNIAQSVGTSEGALYRHFASKEDILCFLVDDTHETLLGDFKNIQNKQLKSLDLLTEAVMRHISNIKRRKGISFLLIAEIISYGDPKLNKKIYNLISNYTENIENLFIKAASEGLISSSLDFRSTSQLFYGMTQGLVNIWALNKYKLNLEEEFKPLWNMFIKTITKPYTPFN